MDFYSSTYFEITDSNFKNNESAEANAIFTGINTDLTRNSLFSNTEFLNNLSEDGGLLFIYSLVNFETCTFTDNSYPNIHSPHMKVYHSALSFADCTFEETQTYEEFIDGYGRFLHIDLKSYVEITNTEFTNGEALQGGAIYLNNCKYNIFLS